MGDGDISFQGWHQRGKNDSPREIDKKNKGKKKKRRHPLLPETDRGLLPRSGERRVHPAEGQQSAKGRNLSKGGLLAEGERKDK